MGKYFSPYGLSYVKLCVLGTGTRTGLSRHSFACPPISDRVTSTHPHASLGPRKPTIAIFKHDVKPRIMVIIDASP